MKDRGCIGDLVDHEIGGGWGLEEATDESPVPAFVIRGTDIPRALVGDVSSVPFRYHKESALRSRILRPNDIVFEVSGGSKDQPVGRALLVSERLLDQFPTEVMCASFCKLIRLDSSRCDPQYIFRILQQAYRSGELDAFQIQSTGITNFRWKLFLDQFVVELPERRVQESVSQVLGLLDDLIKNNRRRVGLLEWMAQAVYQEWFVNFRYPGHESIPLVDSPLGPIPEGWEVGMLDDLLGLQRGFDLPLKNRNPGSVPVIAATGQHGTHEVARAPGPGVVTGRSGSLGTVMYVSEDFWPLNTTLWVKDFRRATPELATYVLRGLGLAQFNSGAAVPTLNRNDVAGQPVAVPPTELVEQFSALARQLLTLIVILQQSSGALRMGRDLLLPHLVSGHIDVSFLDLDAVVESVA